jgi:hypothetical protein
LERFLDLENAEKNEVSKDIYFNASLRQFPQSAAFLTFIDKGFNPQSVARRSCTFAPFEAFRIIKAGAGTMVFVIFVLQNFAEKCSII